MASWAACDGAQPGVRRPDVPAEPAYEVGREKIREFADAIGDPNPVYRDRRGRRALGHPDVIAPPTFPIVVSMRASAAAIFDPDLGLDYSRVVHGEQRFVFARPVRAGDRLVATLSIDSIRTVAGNDILGTRTEIVTEAGEPVVTAHAVIVVARSGGLTMSVAYADVEVGTELPGAVLPAAAGQPGDVCRRLRRLQRHPLERARRAQRSACRT